MSRRKVEGIIWFVAGIILVLLLANKSKMLSDNIGENIFSLILSGITLFFGKMTWFIAIIAMLYGIILFFYEKIGINLTQGKAAALAGLFLSWGMILIRSSVVHGKPLSGNFTEAGRQLLEIGFNRESGGILGALLSMPFFKVLHFQWMFFILLILSLFFVVWLIRDLIELGYEVLREIIKYYKSDEYKEKKRKLAAKKYAENLKKTDYKRYQKEMLKAKIIQSRNEKLSFEIAKKPKENFLQKTEVYSKEEIAEKEKEWIEIFEEKEKGNFEKDEITQKVDEYFGKLANNKVNRREKTEFSFNAGKRVVSKDINQVNICISHQSEDYNSENKIYTDILANIIGGSMSSRLFQEIREKNGLAYSVYTFNQYYLSGGLTSTYIGTNLENYEKAIEITLAEFKKLRESGVTEDELQKAKNKYMSRIAFSMENPRSRMGILGNYYIRKNEILDAEKIKNEVNSVKLEDVNNFAKTGYLTENITVLGNIKK